jgi:hypothetical protein
MGFQVFDYRAVAQVSDEFTASSTLAPRTLVTVSGVGQGFDEILLTNSDAADRQVSFYLKAGTLSILLATVDVAAGTGVVPGASPVNFLAYLGLTNPRFVLPTGGVFSWILDALPTAPGIVTVSLFGGTY